MKFLRYLAFTLTFLWPLLQLAQTYTIKGTTVDIRDNEPVVGVIVKLGSVKQLTDLNGQFTFTVNATGTYVFQTEKTLTHESQKKTIVIDGTNPSVNVTILLIPLTNMLTGVDIKGQGNLGGPISLDPKNAYAIPTVGGGIESLIKTMPGVVSNNELSSQYSVRGGSYDENLTYINDVEVYRPFLVRAGEQEGLSFINPDMVESLTFSAGGFEAKYGDRMSSVLDIKYRRPTKFAGRASASILGFTGLIEGVNKSNRFTYMIGARQRTTQYLLNSLDTRGEYRPSSSDIQSQLTYDIRDNLQLQFLGSFARNLYRVVPTNRETDWGTLNQALRIRMFFEGQEVNSFDTYMGSTSLIWQPRRKWTTKFIASAFTSIEEENFSVLGQYFLNEIETDFGSDDFGQVSALLGVGSFLNNARNRLQSRVYNVENKTYYTNNNSKLTFGLKFQHESFTDRINEWRYVDSAGYAVPSGIDDVVLLQDVLKTTINLASNRMMGFVQYSYTDTTNVADSLKPKHVVSFTAGARANYWTLNNQTVISPRFQFYFKPDWKEKTVYRTDKKGVTDTIVKPRQWVFRLSGGWYYQPPFYRELRSLQGTINPNVRAQESIHIIAGADHYFKAWKRDFKMVVEAYYKFLNNLVPYEIDNVRIRYFAQNLSVGYATGLDFRVNGEFIKGIESWMSLSVMKTAENLRNDLFYNRFDKNGNLIIPGFSVDQNAVDSSAVFPGSIPRPMDQRVTFSIFFQDQLPKFETFKMSLNFVVGTGLPFGPPDFERYKDVLRMPPYRRVDIGFIKELVTDKTARKIAENRPNSFLRHIKKAFISLEVFNLLGINNTVSYLWVEDFSGRNYAIPNFLTNRLINLRLFVQF